MPSLPRATEPAGMTSEPRASAPSVSTPPGIPEPCTMSLAAPALQSLSMPPSQKTNPTMEAASMPRRRPRSRAAALAGPISELPVGPTAAPGAATQGLVCGQGAWHPYTVVQGQMVVEFGSGEILRRFPLWVDQVEHRPLIQHPRLRVHLRLGLREDHLRRRAELRYHLGVRNQVFLLLHLSLRRLFLRQLQRWPVLASARSGDAAVIAGDWPAQLEPSMSSLS